MAAAAAAAAPVPAAPPVTSSLIELLVGQLKTSTGSVQKLPKVIRSCASTGFPQGKPWAITHNACHCESS